MDHKRLLEDFNRELERRRVRLHGASLISGFEVVGEIYKGRYTADTKTRMYSTSKSVAAVAIGKLVGEGLLSLDDRIVDVFADRFDTGAAHPLFKEQTVRHMLTMTTAYSAPTYSPEIKDWLASYFRAEPTHPADTVWYYDSSGSYVLGAIVKHKTGLDYVEYLRDIFDEIGVSQGVYTLKGPDGEAWASSGFTATTTDLGRIAYLLLSGGRWWGKQLLPEDYVRAAISPLKRNDDGAKVSRFDCGYGYQIWSHPNGAFAFRGLGGQIAIGFPGRDLVFSCNSDTAGNHNAYDDIFEAVESIILPAFPVTDEGAYLAAQPVPPERNVFDEIKDTDYLLDKNKLGIDAVRFEGDGRDNCLIYTKGGKEHRIPFKIGSETQIVFPEKYSGETLFNEAEYINYRCSVEARWLEERKLFIKIWAEDLYVGNMTLAFAFREDGRIGVKADKCAQFFFDGFVGFAGGRRA